MPADDHVSNPQQAPIWKNPAWLTAIVAVISAFLTIPTTVSDIWTQRLKNQQDVQERELRLVRTIMKETGAGKERVFILRYLASTSNDKEVRVWAEEAAGSLEKTNVNLSELDSLKSERAELLAQLSTSALPNREQQNRLLEINSKINTVEAELIQNLNRGGLGVETVEKSGVRLIWSMSNISEELRETFEVACKQDAGILLVDDGPAGKIKIQCFMNDAREVVNALVKFVTKSVENIDLYLDLAEKFNLEIPDSVTPTAAALAAIIDPSNSVGNLRIFVNLNMR